MQLEIKNIHKNYGKVQALKGVSMELNAGVYGLLGPNGAGKSTLIQIITGNLSASDGEICYDGKNIKKSEKNYKSDIFNNIEYFNISLWKRYRK